MSEDVILEPFTPFSKSLIWQLQEQAYQSFGPSAWTEKGVPFYVTSNTRTANAFSNTVQSFFRDLASQGIQGPVYLFDLGSGTGRLGYLFLKAWSKWRAKKTFTSLQLRYIMTDVVDANLTFLKEHRLLQPFIREGILDFAYFRPGVTQEIALQISQETLNKVKAPVILLASYFFDTVPQELYRVDSGKLFQGHIELKVNHPVENRLDPKLISEIQYAFRYDPIPKLNSPWKELLEEHAERMDTATFLFPIGALQTLDFFRKLTDGPLLLLAQDQAIVSERQWQWQEDPGLALHGSFSLIVSYYTIKRYFERLGGHVWLPDCPATTLTTLGAVLSTSSDWEETCDAYQENIGQFDPWAFNQLVSHVEKKIDQLGDMVRLIRLAHLDPILLYSNYQKIREAIPQASIAEKQDLLKTVLQLPDHFYPIGPNDADFIMDLGVLCFDMGAYEEAMNLFYRASALGCKHPSLVQNMVLAAVWCGRNII
jgi:hypothetical protein